VAKCPPWGVFNPKGESVFPEKCLSPLKGGVAQHPNVPVVALQKEIQMEPSLGGGPPLLPVSFKWGLKGNSPQRGCVQIPLGLTKGKVFGKFVPFKGGVPTQFVPLLRFCVVR